VTIIFKAVLTVNWLLKDVVTLVTVYFLYMISLLLESVHLVTCACPQECWPNE